MTALSALLDTNILIDVLRGYPPAIQWIQNNAPTRIGIPSFVRMEMVLGADNKTEQQRVIKLLKPFPLVYTTETDAQWAMEQFEIYHLSHQVEIIDCFIAATCARLHVPIYSHNIKDLSVFSGVTVFTPYS